MNSFEIAVSALELSANPRVDDAVRLRTGESGASREYDDTAPFVMNALAHAISEGRSMEDAQTQLNAMFPGRELNLQEHVEKLAREADQIRFQ